MRMKEQNNWNKKKNNQLKPTLDWPFCSCQVVPKLACDSGVGERGQGGRVRMPPTFQEGGIAPSLFEICDVAACTQGVEEKVQRKT